MRQIQFVLAMVCLSACGTQSGKAEVEDHKPGGLIARGVSKHSGEPAEHGIETVTSGGWRFGLKWYHAANAFDGNYGTNWIGALPGSDDAWVEAILNASCNVGKVVLRDRVSSSHNPKQARIIFSGGEEMVVDYPEAYTQGRKPLEVTFEPVKTTSVRVHVLSNYTDHAAAALNEVEIFERLPDESYRKLVYEGPEVLALRKRRAESQKRISETDAYLNELRANVDISGNPRFGTSLSVDDSSSVATVNKEPWSLSWSLATGCIVSATIKDVDFDDAELSSFSVVDDAGKRYFQNMATDGSFEARDSKFELTIRGSFTPRTSEGEAYPTQFDCVTTVHKMGSLVETRYTARDAGTPVKEIRILNTLGAKSGDHDQVYTYGYYPGIMSVANRGVGLQCHLISWDERFFSKGGEEKEKLLVQRNVAGRRHIDVVLANFTGPLNPTIEAGDEFSFAFSPLPVRVQPTFKPIWCHPWAGMPWSTGQPFGKADQQYIDDYSAKWGETYFIIGAQWPTRITNSPENFREFVKYAHHTGNKVMVYMDVRWNNPDRVCYEGDLSYEEMMGARMVHELDNGLSVGSSPWRRVLLDWYRRLFTDYSIDAIYIDSINEDNDLPDPSHGNVLGINAFMEELRLLVDELTNDKIIVLHMLGQDSTPHVALGDLMLPGEHLQQSYVEDIRGLDLQYNPYLYGCDHIAYTARSYDQANPHVVNQLLKYPLSPWLTTYLTGPEWAISANEPKGALDAYRNYRKPVFDFCKDGGAVVHHPLDTDDGKWLEVASEDDVTVTLYQRTSEALIVATTESAPVSRLGLRLNLLQLGWSDADLTVTDKITGAPVDYSVKGDWIGIRNLRIEPWPRIIHVSSGK